ncbi:D-alanine--D-alanine ligase [Edaphobacillus lindanitolerans]|uniref:D-alanine--D-alanine ligase n=1 Tax=Edaphobacillus lindanitolerans TaxID=550447 RepID=A0A1U7PSI0_9BACI|nr:D-alanine--D-alanine ligase [Edaphobacillus lindanitolerans]SIT89561.1 D-alanine-D-alanine ligase [Edaphobacillus lindanitolerans]
MKNRIFLLYGGKSAEHDVSLSTARAVSHALDFSKYDVTPVFITPQGEWRPGPLLAGPAEQVTDLLIGEAGTSAPARLADGIGALADEAPGQPVVIPLLHGPNGEDGTVQGLLEVMDLPYVGNGVLASAAGMDKVVMKQLFGSVGLNQVPFVHFIRSEWESDRDVILAKVEARLSWPVFVKPANLGSSVGISRATDRVSLIRAIGEALRYDRKVIIEQGVDGREIEMGLLGNDDPKCSVIGEISSASEFYDYESKYQDGNTVLTIPAEIPEPAVTEMERMAKAAFKVLDCSGLVRADFFLTKDNEVLINEVNTMPGFTPTSMFPLLWQHTGMTYPELIEELIRLALERHAEKQSLNTDRN